MSSLFLTTATTLFTLLTGLSLCLWRLWAITRPGRRKPSRRPGETTHLLIVLGSGGHTAEMLAMLERAASSAPEKSHKVTTARRENWWQTFSHRTWLISAGDALSARRAEEFEKAQSIATSNRDAYTISTVPRAREIHQPLLTTPISALCCLWACLQLLITSNSQGERVDLPDLILCNGPATATILVLASILLRFFDIRGCESRGKLRTVYVESWARVKKLSLSGRLLSHYVDRFLVQWPQLEAPGSRAEYLGVLV